MCKSCFLQQSCEVFITSALFVKSYSLPAIMHPQSVDLVDISHLLPKAKFVVWACCVFTVAIV